MQALALSFFHGLLQFWFFYEFESFIFAWKSLLVKTSTLTYLTLSNQTWTI